MCVLLIGYHGIRQNHRLDVPVSVAGQGRLLQKVKTTARAREANPESRGRSTFSHVQATRRPSPNKSVSPHVQSTRVRNREEGVLTVAGKSEQRGLQTLAVHTGENRQAEGEMQRRSTVPRLGGEAER